MSCCWPGSRALVCWQVRRRPYLFVGWFWFVGLLVPVIGLVQVGSQARADRYTYLPLIGLFVMLAWGLHDLLPRRRLLLAGLAAAVLLVCLGLTRQQVRYWDNNLALWEHTVAVTGDNAIARIVYGKALMERGDMEGADEQFRRRLGSSRSASRCCSSSAVPASISSAGTKPTTASRMRIG